MLTTLSTMHTCVCSKDSILMMLMRLCLCVYDVCVFLFVCVYECVCVLSICMNAHDIHFLHTLPGTVYVCTVSV